MDLSLGTFNTSDDLIKSLNNENQYYYITPSLCSKICKTKKFENLAIKLGVDDMIHIAGETSDIPALLMLSDVYVATNIEPKASMVTMLEAESLGRPIIASKVGSTPEYILDETTCKTFDPKNFNEFIDAIVWSLKITEEERAEISQKLSTHVRLNFAKNTIPQKIVNIYKYTLGLK